MTIETINKKLFTVDEFYRMADAGILPEDGRFELIRGGIVEMPLPGSPHAGRVKLLNYLFTTRLGQAAIVSVQDPVRLNLYNLDIKRRGESVQVEKIPNAVFSTDEILGPKSDS